MKNRAQRRATGNFNPVNAHAILMKQAVAMPHNYKLTMRTYNQLKKEGYAV